MEKSIGPFSVTPLTNFRPDQLIMMPKAELLTYSIHILHVIL